MTTVKDTTVGDLERVKARFWRQTTKEERFQTEI